MFAKAFGLFESRVDDVSSGVEEFSRFGIALLIELQSLLYASAVTAAQRCDEIGFFRFLDGIDKITCTEKREYSQTCENK